MDEIPPLIAFAAVMGFMAFFYIRYPEAVKRWRDNSPLFESQRRANSIYTPENYRTFGWCMAFGSFLTIVAALVILLSG